LLAALLLGAPGLAAQPAPPDAKPRIATFAKGQVFGIFGNRVQDADGKDAGRIWDVLVDDEGHPRAAVIDYGGTLGMGRRKIAVEWQMLKFAPADPAHPIQVMLTLKDLGMLPEFKYDADAMTAGDGR
jgi:hypothetical protein